MFNKNMIHWSVKPKENSDGVSYVLTLKNLVVFVCSVELLYLVMIILNVTSVLIAFIAFVAVFILPGLLLLILLLHDSKNISILKLIVEGFFLSMVLASLIPILFLILNIPLNTIICSFVNLIVVSFLVLGIYTRYEHITIKILRRDIFMIVIILLFSFYLFIFFSFISRFFTPDETLYIYSARFILLGYIPTPFDSPQSSFFRLVVLGRVMWYSQLAYFFVATSHHPYFSNLLGISFLVMISLSPVLFFDERSEKTSFFASFFIILTTPILISFVGTYLNDLALSFYIVIAIAYFSNAISKNSKCEFAIDFKELTKSLIVILFSFLIKPNVLFLLSMWIILFYVFLITRKKKCTSISFSFLKVLITLPLFYEFFIDIPFFVSYWILKDYVIASFFVRYVLMSPTTMLVRIFLPLPTNPNSRTFLSLSTIDHVDRLYRLISFESINFLTSAIMLVLPLLFLIKHIRTNLELKFFILTTILEVSLWNFFLLSYSMFGDIPRYSLWMFPLWIILTIKILRISLDKRSLIFPFLICLAGCVLYQMNIFITSKKKGVFVGYLPESRINTASILFWYTLMIFLIFFISYLIERMITKNTRVTCANTFFHKYITKSRLTKTTFASIIILILISNLYFTQVFISNNKLYKDHGLYNISQTLSHIVSSDYDSSIIIANNYLYMRSYIDENILKEGKFLPLPDTNESLTTFINTAPENTLFLISGDPSTAWFSYNDRYMTKYADSDVITPETKKVEKYPNITLPSRVLYMTFDDMNKTIIPDKSNYSDFGVNYGVSSTKGLFNNAAYFNGSTYISIKTSKRFDITDSLTISFFALIEKAEPHRGHMIVSKGHGYFNGSYSVFVYNTYIYFDLGGVGRLYFSALPYVGAWHHYIFIYNNKKMMAFVDGVLAGVTYASGPIRKSDYPLEIGRDSERGDYFFVGKLDELQISPIAMSAITVASTYFDSYAVRIKTIITPTGNCSIFRLVHEKPIVTNITTNSIKLKKASLSLLSNDSVSINVQIQNTVSVNNITLLAANEKAVRAFTLSLTKGMNNLSFIIPKEPGWSYWYYSTTIRLIIISNGKIISNSVVHLFDLKVVYLTTLIILIGLLMCYLLLIDENALKKINSILTRILKKYRS